MLVRACNFSVALSCGNCRCCLLVFVKQRGKGYVKAFEDPKKKYVGLWPKVAGPFLFRLHGFICNYKERAEHKRFNEKVQLAYVRANMYRHLPTNRNRNSSRQILLAYFS